MPRNAKNRRKDIQKARNLESQKEAAKRRWPGTRHCDLGMPPVLPLALMLSAMFFSRRLR